MIYNKIISLYKLKKKILFSFFNQDLNSGSLYSNPRYKYLGNILFTWAYFASDLASSDIK